MSLLNSYFFLVETYKNPWKSQVQVVCRWINSIFTSQSNAAIGHILIDPAIPGARKPLNCLYLLIFSVSVARYKKRIRLLSEEWMFRSTRKSFYWKSPQSFGCSVLKFDWNLLSKATPRYLTPFDNEISILPILLMLS